MADLVAPPPTDHAALVDELLALGHADVAGHSLRSFQFAAALALDDGVELDLEVLYLGTVLHDVGLAPELDGPARFEARGANEVRSRLRGSGMDPARAELVWDVIALHATSDLARHKAPETDYANRGISIDVSGRGVERLPVEFVRDVLARWPRDTFPVTFADTLTDEVRRHPDTARFCWMESVAAAAIPGYERPDFLVALAASPDRFPVVPGTQ